MKSAFIDSDILYVLYYEPFMFQSLNRHDMVYSYGLDEPLPEGSNPYIKVPFYLIYDIKTSQFAYLNAKKEVIEGNAHFNVDVLKKLGSSHSVHLGKYNFETSPHVQEYDIHHQALFKKFNDYLNSQISK